MKPWLPQPATSSGAAAQGVLSHAPLMAWATCGSDVGPRGMPDALLRLGPLMWARDHVAPKLIGKGITHCVIWMPGGREESGADLRFDTVSQALRHSDPRVHACGDYSIWAESAQIIRQEAGCKVGFYVGTSHGQDVSKVLEECENMVVQWNGYADFIVIDTLADRPMGHTDHVAAHRLAAARFEVWSEPRPIVGKPLYPTVHMCLASKWHSSGSSFGDRYHANKEAFTAQGASVVLIDDVTVNAETVQLSRAVGIGWAVSPAFVPVVGNAGGAK